MADFVLARPFVATINRRSSCEKPTLAPDDILRLIVPSRTPVSTLHIMVSSPVPAVASNVLERLTSNAAIAESYVRLLSPPTLVYDPSM